MVRIGIIFYSMYGNTALLARAVAEGVSEVDEAEALLLQVPELVPEEVIESNERMLRTKESLKDVPMAKKKHLAQCDGFVFGTPTRFGNMSAQLKQFLDQTGEEWAKGVLVGKPAGAFTSTSTAHGGQETTILSTMIVLLHHGMILVGVPYTEQRLFATEGGGSPYGASSISGPEADRPPTEHDLAIARTLGKRVAEVAKRLVGQR